MTQISNAVRPRYVEIPFGPLKGKRIDQIATVRLRGLLENGEIKHYSPLERAIKKELRFR